MLNTKILQNFIADSEVASHLYRFTVYVTGNFSTVVGAERVLQYRRHPGYIKNVDECWRAIGIHARTRNVPRKFRIFEEEKMVLGEEARADVDSWPGSDGKLICHSGCMEVCSEVGEYIIHPLSWARRGKQTGRRERSGTRLGVAWRKQRASRSKKGRDVSLTRDLPRTINCGGAEIIRDFVAVTCDANKSFVPITYARLKLELLESANLKTCVCSTAREWKTRK